MGISLFFKNLSYLLFGSALDFQPRLANRNGLVEYSQFSAYVFHNNNYPDLSKLDYKTSWMMVLLVVVVVY